MGTATGSAVSRPGALTHYRVRRSGTFKGVQQVNPCADTRSVNAADGMGKDYIAGMTIPELASKYGMSERAVWKRVRRYRSNSCAPRPRLNVKPRRSRAGATILTAPPRLVRAPRTRTGVG
jgi:hypothetical protein